MRKTKRDLERPRVQPKVLYRNKYVLKDRETEEIVFIGNGRECAEYLGMTFKRFNYIRASIENYGYKKNNKDFPYIINKVKQEEWVIEEGENRKKVEANARFAKKYRCREKPSRFRNNGRREADSDKG